MNRSHVFQESQAGKGGQKWPGHPQNTSLPSKRPQLNNSHEVIENIGGGKDR